MENKIHVPNHQPGIFIHLKPWDWSGSGWNMMNMMITRPGKLSQKTMENHHVQWVNGI